MKPVTAVIFPGQGSQTTGMLSDFSDNKIIQTLFKQASDKLNVDLWEITQKNPDNLLNQTQFTQPALLTASVALWHLQQKQENITPVVLAGHSLGEYTALVCAESLLFEDAVELVASRGKFMQEACPNGQGAMAAVIGLSPEEITQICLDNAQNQILSPANFNAPGQIVIAGDLQAVERAMISAKKAGAKLVKKLDVSVPSHCLLMKPAAEKMKILLDNCAISLPKIPVIQNADACAYDNIDAVRDALVRQLFSSVRWVESIEKIVRDYVPERLIECGPGNVLAGLNKRILKNPVLNINIQEILKNV